MSTSTNGVISFGVVCEEDTVFPWDESPFDGDIDVWWRHENGYVPIYEPFTSDGDFAEGWTENDKRFTEYYEHGRRWEDEHPLPVELVNYCSASVPMHIISLPDVGTSCRRGYPREFIPAELTVTDEQVDSLLSFLEKYKIESDSNPRWLLTSYWGV